jgi:hypothetical protein
MAYSWAAALLVSLALPLSAGAAQPATSEGSRSGHQLPLDSAPHQIAARPASIVRSFDDVRGQPYNVSYDDRSLRVDNMRVLLLGGSFHYPRAPPEEWRGIMQAMKDDGLNHLQMYTFWNLHEQKRGVYDFSDASRANITRLLATAAEVGLFVNVRLGPYVCAEWNFGGLPVWLRDLPGVVFRDNNRIWKREMATWVRRVTAEIEPFLARTGGPVMLVQIENEYNAGWFGSWEPVAYIDWAGELAKNLSLGVPTMMCNGLSAPGTLNAYNGDDGSAYAASHAVEYPGQPLLWAEDEMGAAGWGQALLPGRKAADVAHGIARWVALGAAHHNYYMYFGGNHVKRWAGMAIANAYADAAPMHSDRLPNEPLHSHVSRLHHLLAEHAATLLGSPMQQRSSFQRGTAADEPELVPTTTTARLGTIACDASDLAQQFTLRAGGDTLRARVDDLEVCVAAVVTRGHASAAAGLPIGACNSSNSSQIFRFSDDAKGQGTLCSASGMCLCATDPLGAEGAIGIAASEQSIGLMNTSTTQSLGESCKWMKSVTGGLIESMVQPPPVSAVCTSNNMSLYLGKPESSSHYPGGTPETHTIAEAERICDANFLCAGFIYHALTNDTAIDCTQVYTVEFREAIVNHVGFDKSWKTFTKRPIAYPYPDPRTLSQGQQTKRCLTSGFASPACGICESNHDPCTCAFIYGSGAESLAFVQNAGTAVTNFSLPGSPETVIDLAANSISLVSGGVTLFNTATIEGCVDPESCLLPTVRQNVTIAGNSSSRGSATSVLSWRRWTEPALLNTADVAKAVQSQEPLEQLNVTQDRTDYLFYQRAFTQKVTTKNATLYLGTRHGSALSAFVDGVFKGANVNLVGPYSSWVILPIDIGALSAGAHHLTILSAAIGISNYPAHGTAGPHGQLPAHGITGEVVLSTGALNTSLTSAAPSSWSHLAGLAGERARVFAGGPTPAIWKSNSSSVVYGGAEDTLPLSWFRTTFPVPPNMVASVAAGNASFLLDPAGMARGHVYLNGADLGRYYPAAPGAATAGLGGMLYLPPSLLEGTNVLVLGDELGATQPSAVRVVLSTLAPPLAATSSFVRKH